MNTPDARMYERIPLGQKVSIIANSSAPPLRLWATNISEGGVCVQTPHPFRRGDRVGLRMRCRDAELCIPNAEVSWVVREVNGSSRQPAVGLRFLTLPPEERQALRALLDQQRSQSAEPQPHLPEVPSSRQAKDPVDAMHTEPSLPPLSPLLASSLSPACISPSPDDEQTLPPESPGRSNNISLGPLPEDDPRWEFSDSSGEPQQSMLRANSSGFAFAAGLLVVGTVAGMVFGVMDQKAPPPGSPPLAQTAETPREAPTPEVAAKASTVAQKPKPALAAKLLAAPAAKPARPQKLVDMPLPARKPGQLSLGSISSHGTNLVVPIRGVRNVEKQFVLRAPSRLVMDLASDGYDGPAEVPGRGSIERIRVGKRPGGVRLVFDLQNAAVAQAARTTRQSGVVAVVLPSR
jgi:uncharacterized protein (TIGR02266 family)